MPATIPKVTIERKYAVRNVAEAKEISRNWLKEIQLDNTISFGLPEVDDRYHIWRVPLVGRDSKKRLGEIVIDAYSSVILSEQTTTPQVLEARLLGRKNEQAAKPTNGQAMVSFLRNSVISGDCEHALQDLPAESVDLVFTSPPYFNARPEYEDYLSYDEYLLKMRKVIHQAHRVLAEGRFLSLTCPRYSFAEPPAAKLPDDWRCLSICTRFSNKKAMTLLTTLFGLNPKAQVGLPGAVVVLLPTATHYNTNPSP